jgi:Ni/Co efflux regulator RcnB
MRGRTFLHLFIAAIFAFGCTLAFAQDDGRDRDRDRGRDEYREDKGHDHFYNDHDRDAMRAWYRDHHDHLPPGFGDRLTPEQERYLVANGVLPPELRPRMYPCPHDLEQTLPPPPPGCAHMVIGGHVVLVNPATFQIVDVFHVEL